jgi:uncharacterized protein
MSDLYGRGARELQDRFDARRLADRLDQRLVRDHLTPENRALIESLDMFFLATVDERGRPSCSYKGGDPGFIKAADEKTLIFPSYDGNGMFLSLGNVLETREVGLLFVDFVGQTRLRVNGVATLDMSPEVCAAFTGAQLVVRVTVREVFPNCSRYIHKYQLLERSRFVPQPEVPAPTPAWKEASWAADVLPNKS